MTYDDLRAASTEALIERHRLQFVALKDALGTTWRGRLVLRLMAVAYAPSVPGRRGAGRMSLRWHLIRRALHLCRGCSETAHHLRETP